MSEILTSMNQKDLEYLAAAHRKHEILSGIIRTVSFKMMPIETENGIVTREQEVAEINLRGGVKAYCPDTEFHHSFSSIRGFTGSLQEFVVDRLDLDNQIAIVSIKKADEIKAAKFWDTLEYLEKKGELENEVFEGKVTGYKLETQNIFVRIQGVDTFMNRRDWDYGYVPNVADIAERGATVKVKVVRFNKENGVVHVSRKATQKDPFNFLLENQNAESIAGKVSNVHPVHGIFIKLEDGLEVKGMKPRQLPEPIVGDVVSVRVQRVDPEKRRAKVVILGYPQGKKTRKDVGDFLFD